MIFSSLIFLFIFLPVSLLAYYLLPRRCRNACLMIFSLVFYAWGEPVYIFLMLFTVSFDYGTGRLIFYFRNHAYLKKTILIFGICINLGLLVFFKYSGLLIGTFNSWLHLAIPVPPVTLPIGISFYTFESLSYSMDIYRGDAAPQRSFIDFGTYLSFFPHLVAGPIIRYCDMEYQLTARTESLEKFTSGCVRFLTGLFKKVLIANQLALISDKIQYYGSPSTLSAWIGASAFTFQIYFDFSGYSDMAIGMGQMFGFRLPENFNAPYSSLSATEFWRRWHMTLGGWFREYLYIPLGGNRCSKIKNVRNLAIVWVLTGLWHGASWNFAVWGAYWGLLIILEKLFLKNWLDKIPVLLQWLYAFLAAVIGWVFFSNPDLIKAWNMLCAMFGFAAGADRLGMYSLLTGWPILAISTVCCTPYPRRLAEKLRQSGTAGKAVWCTGLAVLFLASVSFLVNNAYNPFLYFRF